MSESKSWKAWRREYKALKEIIEDRRVPESVRLVAKLEFDAMELATFTVTMKCLLCKQDYKWDVTAPQMAEWRDDPRGICGPCNARTSAVVEDMPTVVFPAKAGTATKALDEEAHP